MPSLPVGSLPSQAVSAVPSRMPLAPAQAQAPRSTQRATPVDSFEPAARAASTSSRPVRPADGLRAYGELSPAQQALLGEGGAARYAALGSKERAAFVVLTTRMGQLGLDTAGLKLKPQPAGIQEDRLMFEAQPAGAMEKLKAGVRAAIARGDFQSDTPAGKLHPGMDEFGARQWVTRESMQLGFGKDGAFVDIDRFGPKTDLVGLFGHLGEVVIPGKTDFFKVARALHIDVASRLP